SPGADRGVRGFDFGRCVRLRFGVDHADWPGAMAPTHGLSDEVPGGPTALFDRDGIPDLSAGLCIVWTDATTADLQSRPQRCHQRRRKPVQRAPALGAARYSAGG